MNSQRVPAVLIVVLVILTSACGCAAMLGYIRYREEARASNQLRQERDQLAQREQATERTIDFLRERLGYHGPMSLEDLRQSVQEDLHEYSGEVAGENYRSVLEYLVRTIAQERSRAAKVTELHEQLQARLATVEPSYEKRVEVHRKFQEQTAAELVKEQGQSRKNLQILENQIAALLDRIETNTVKLQEAYRQRDQDRDVATKKIQTLLAGIRALRAEKARETDPAKDAPDGKVVFVDSSARTVTLDIGQTQGVRMGMTFRVFRADPLGRADKAVASVEVIRLEPKRSVAAIRKNDLLVPILSGDLVFNPILRDKLTESFALAGKLDVDGDGKDDTNLLRRLIEKQGGRIDLRIDTQGNVVGKLSLTTKYVVMDDKSEQGDKDYRQLLSQLHREALDHGIPVISARRFADELGYQNDLRVSR